MKNGYLDSWKELLQLPKEIWLWSFGVLVNRMGTMVLPFMTLYLTKDLGHSPETAGMILGIYGGGAIVATIFSGWISSQIGPINTVFYCLLTSSLFLGVYPFFKSALLLIPLTIMMSIANEAFRPASWSAVSSFATKEHRRMSFTLVRVAINLGMSVGPAVGGLLFVFSPKALFWVDGGTCFLSAIVIYWFFVRKKYKLKSEKVTVLENLFVPFKDKRFLYYFIALLPVGIVFFQNDSSAPLFFADTLKLNPKHYGFFYTINTILIVTLEVPLTSMLKHWTYVKTMVLGCILMGMGFGAYCFASGFWTMAIGVGIWTFGEMVLFPATGAFVSDIASDKYRASYMGMQAFSFNLAFLIAPPLGIHVLTRYGSDVLWTGCFLFSLLAVVGLRWVAKEVAVQAERA